jgi:YHS domain-containing protein
VVLLAAPLAAQGKPQTTCPVLGGNLNKNIFVDYKGSRIYFCCAGCDKEFQKDPEKYLKKLQDQGVTPEKSPGGAKGK